MSSYHQKMRYGKKQQSIAHKQEKKPTINRKYLWQDPDDSKDFKAAIMNILKEVKETMLKEWKESIMTMSYQIGNT